MGMKPTSNGRTSRLPRTPASESAVVQRCDNLGARSRVKVREPDPPTPIEGVLDAVEAASTCSETQSAHVETESAYVRRRNECAGPWDGEGAHDLHGVFALRTDD